MLIIRIDQQRALAENRRRCFEQEIAAELQARLPECCAALGEELSEAISYGVERAIAYGLNAEVGVAAFVKLMFIFGPDYETDPQLPWAHLSLTAIDPADQASRIRHFLTAAEQAIANRGGD